MIFTAVRDIWTAFKEYTEQAVLFAIAAMVIYIAITIIVCMVRFFQKKQPYSMWYVLSKTCLFALFGIYLSYLLALTLSGRDSRDASGVMNIIPFSTMTGPNPVKLFLFENVILFIPFGVLTPVAWKYFRGIFRTTVMGFATSVLIETAQIVLRKGYFDVDDIILNTLGTIIGYILFSGIYDGFMGIKRRILTDVAHKLKKKPPLGKLYNRLALRNGLILFMVQLMPVILCVIMIMGFSSDDGETSGMVSKKILSKIFNIISSDSVITPTAINASETLLFYERILRKIAHMTEYALLAVLVWALIYSVRWVYRIFAYLCGLAATFAVGMIDETNQMEVLGRTGAYTDVVIDVIGAFVALFFVAVIVRIVHYHYLKKSQNQKPSRSRH